MAIRNRAPHPSIKQAAMQDPDPNNPRRPLLGANQETSTQDATSAIRTKATATATQTAEEEKLEMERLSKTSQWIVLALASGGCAAFNGAFAKL